MLGNFAPISPLNVLEALVVMVDNDQVLKSKEMMKEKLKALRLLRAAQFHIRFPYSCEHYLMYGSTTEDPPE